MYKFIAPLLLIGLTACQTTKSVEKISVHNTQSPAPIYHKHHTDTAPILYRILAGDWYLKSVKTNDDNFGELNELPKNTQIAINSNGTRLGGTVGCNWVGMDIILADNGDITRPPITSVNSTLKSCGQVLDKQETALTKFLQSVKKVSIDNHLLTLDTQNGVQLTFFNLYSFNNN